MKEIAKEEWKEWFALPETQEYLRKIGQIGMRAEEAIVEIAANTDLGPKMIDLARKGGERNAMHAALGLAHALGGSNAQS
jgi:hypothetical protein